MNIGKSKIFSKEALDYCNNSDIGRVVSKKVLVKFASLEFIPKIRGRDIGSEGNMQSNRSIELPAPV